MKHKKQCDGCIYWRSLVNDLKECHYCIDTGKLRGCEPDESCIRRENETKRKRFASNEVITVKMEDI